MPIWDARDRIKNGRLRPGRQWNVNDPFSLPRYREDPSARDLVIVYYTLSSSPVNKTSTSSSLGAFDTSPAKRSSQSAATVGSSNEGEEKYLNFNLLGVVILASRDPD